MNNTQELTTTYHQEPQADVLAVIAQANLAESSKRKYAGAMGLYLFTGGNPFDAANLREYASGLGESSKAHLKAAVRLYSGAMLDAMNNHADPLAENAIELEARMAQTTRKVIALQNAVKVKSTKGQATHIWLSQTQVKALLDTCAGDGLKAERDRLALGLLVAAGLRRAEAASLEFSDIKLQPCGDKMRTVLALRKGTKGGKPRTVPISDALANALDRWGRHVAHKGKVLRSLDQRKELRESMSTAALFNLVRQKGVLIGKPELAPHDLRRTFAQLGYAAGVPVTQISKLLGHTNLATTQRYLNLDLDLETTASDFIPF